MRGSLTNRAYPSYRRKAKRFFSVLLPIFVTQIALTATGFFDTVMSGHVSEQDLAGVAVGSNLFMPFFGSFLGIISVLTPIVAQLHGAGKRERIDFVVRQGFYWSLGLAGVFLLLGIFLCPPSWMFSHWSRRSGRSLRGISLPLPSASCRSSSPVSCATSSMHTAARA